MVSLMYEIMHVNSYGDEDAIAKHYQLNIQEFLGILVHVLMVCPFQWPFSGWPVPSATMSAAEELYVESTLILQNFKSAACMNKYTSMHLR